MSPGEHEDGEGIDRISDLPDAVLGEIISLLPTKEGSRTQILASRWRHLWHSAPLNLNYHGLPFDGDELAGIISDILSSHLGPGRYFCIPSYYLSDRAATLDVWLRSPALDNLQELDLSFTMNKWHLADFLLLVHRTPLMQQQLEPLPASVFRFSNTLRVATIERWNIPDGTVEGLHFPKLEKLTLKMVGISESSLHHMIAGCPALECLLIIYSFGFRCVRINSHSLRSIGVHARCPWTTCLLQFGELIIENAPCLERLLHLDQWSDLQVSVICAPKLKTIRYLLGQAYSTKILFSSTFIQGLHVDGLATVVRTVQILAVDMTVLSLDTVIYFMRCFPCLEKLYIQSSGPGASNLWRRKHRDLITSLDIRLKTIVFERYRGTRSEVSFLTFFVFNARVLELMTLQIGVGNHNEKFLAEQYRKLQLENRASRGAQFQFRTDRCIRNSRDIKDACDLDLTDPFVC